MRSVVVCQKVVKKYGSFEAVAGVDFEIKPGEIFGLLGPNGAGKSTLIRMIYGATLRSSGTLSVLGFDPDRQARLLKRYLGVVPQENCLDESLSVFENLIIFAKYRSLDSWTSRQRIDEYLELFSLQTKSKAIIKTLSGGMQRRLAFVRALIANPDLLILDEPTTGLDPAVRHLLWEKILELRKAGKTILLTTHYMEEAERLCERLVIVDRGKIVASGTPEELRSRVPNARTLEDVFLHSTGRRLDVDE